MKRIFLALSLTWLFTAHTAHAHDPSSGYVLRDAEGVSIGEVYSVQAGNSVKAVTLLLTLSASDGTTHTAMLQTNSLTWFDAPVYFNEADCMGTPYVRSHVGFFPALSAAAIAGPEAPKLYLGTKQETQTVKALSQIGRDPSSPCRNFGEPLKRDDFVEVEVVIDDLDAKFPRPFSLGRY